MYKNNININKIEKSIMELLNMFDDNICVSINNSIFNNNLKKNRKIKKNKNNYRFYIFLKNNNNIRIKNKICYYIKIYEIIKNKYIDCILEIQIEKTVEYILKINGTKNLKGNRYYYRNMIKRCLYLYNNYYEHLDIFDFKLSSIIKLSDNNWNYLLKYLDKLININNIIEKEYRKRIDFNNFYIKDNK